MRRIYLIDSPLEKGDKGGCEAALEEINKRQPPPPPFLRGNISEILCFFPCPAGLMGKAQIDKGRVGGVL